MALENDDVDRSRKLELDLNYWAIQTMIQNAVTNRTYRECPVPRQLFNLELSK